MTISFCINGVFLKPEEAVIPALDRGFLFGDGIYEVIAVIGGKLIEFERHYARMARSLAEIDIASPYNRESFLEQCRALVAHSRLEEGSIYIQITRGADTKRDFAFPATATPTVMLFSSPKNLLVNPLAVTGVSVVSVPDQRWSRRDIKSIALLAQVLAKQEAQSRGGFEAMMVNASGVVTEGSSSSILMVDELGQLVVKPLTHEILPGCTRSAVLALSQVSGIRVVERDFTLEECLRAKEVILTSALHFVLPVHTIDEKPIGTGKPGMVAAQLRAVYLEHALATAV